MRSDGGFGPQGEAMKIRPLHELRIFGARPVDSEFSPRRSSARDANRVSSFEVGERSISRGSGWIVGQVIDLASAFRDEGLLLLLLNEPSGTSGSSLISTNDSTNLSSV